MKREKRDYKLKYKRHIKNGTKDYNANPKLLRLEVAIFKFIDSRRKKNKLDNLQNNSTGLLNSSFKQIKQIKQNSIMDAKVKHRKKREGD